MSPAVETVTAWCALALVLVAAILATRTHLREEARAEAMRRHPSTRPIRAALPTRDARGHWVA